MSSADGPRWRVFISHTGELRAYPQGESYVAAVERAISAAGHVIVDMADFPAADQPPAQLCEQRVHGCEVYVGVLGTRYGSPVRDRPQVSYTELEFDTATGASLDRLVFMLDTNADNVGIPVSQLLDREFGARQDAFRHRVRDSGLTTQSFASPAQLGQLVERSLRELAHTRLRIDSGIGREQVPVEPRPDRGSRFVNPPPAVAPSWFQGRHAETVLLGQYVTDGGIRLVTVVGRAGVGKTALVCRFLKGLEAGRVLDGDGEMCEMAVGGIVYLSHTGLHPVDYPTLVTDLLKLLPADAAQRLDALYRHPQSTPGQVMRAVLEAFPANGGPVVMLLDNLESVMDTERETITELALNEALAALMTAPAHAVVVIATTRVVPTALLRVEAARQRQLHLDAGLGSPDAENLLRALDPDGRLGLRDAPDTLLDGLRVHTRGFPRALEAVKAILDGDRTLTPADLLDRTTGLPEETVVQALAGDAYDLLDPDAQQVMQALAVYPAPVSPVGVDFLLQPINPTIDAVPILKRLVRRQMVSPHERTYHLHPVDRDYARAQLSPGRPGDPPGMFTLTGLKARAAQYYQQIRTPRESWRTIDDLRPQLAEFELRCDTGDYDTAAAILQDVDFNYLRVWGHSRALIELHQRIYGHITGPYQNAIHLTNLALAHKALGSYRSAIDLHTQVLAITRKLGHRQGESAALGNLGICHYDLGDYRQAIDLYAQSLAIKRDIRDRQGESNQLGNLGVCYEHLGDYQQAIDLHTQSLSIAHDVGARYSEAMALSYLGQAWLGSGDLGQAVHLFEQAITVTNDTGDIEPAAYARAGLAMTYLELGNPAAALAAATRTQPTYPRTGPVITLLKGLAMLKLNHTKEAANALASAISSADALITLADNNIAAMQARAIALNALATTTSPAKATQATAALTRLKAATDAAGVTATTQRLLEIVERHYKTTS